MHTKRLLATLLAACTLIVSTAPAQAASAVADGQPDIDQNSPTGYYIWRHDGFHLRTHGPHARHDFDAILRSDGLFENVDPVRLEEANHDRVELRDGGHVLVIHFHTYDFADGVSFTIRDGDRLHFNLQLDHELIPTDHIFLGAERQHPDHNPFTIRL